MKPDYKNICIDALGWARDQDYKGYSKFDALNSPMLAGLAGGRRLLRGAFVFAMSRMPVNLRPVLFVRKKQNPKGLALFAGAYFNLYEITGDESFKEEGLRLLEVLLALSQREKYSGHCWGYDHPWQNIAFFIPAYEPNCVVTCAAGEGFLRAYQLTGKEEYLQICQSIAEFILRDLKQIDVAEGMRCCSYDLNSDWKVVNVNAMAAAFLAKLFEITNNDKYKAAGREMMRWVISQKTDYHAWYYTDPPGDSRITHDGYHTGFVLDAIGDYLKIFPDEAIEKAWRDGLGFYKTNLFTDDFAPKWMYDRKYPADIHGAAQGIITFSRSEVREPGSIDFAGSVLEWVVGNLYDQKGGRFFYQKGRHWTKRFTLMRWCQAWMCYAISEHLLSNSHNEQSSQTVESTVQTPKRRPLILLGIAHLHHAFSNHYQPLANSKLVKSVTAIRPGPWEKTALNKITVIPVKQGPMVWRLIRIFAASVYMVRKKKLDGIVCFTPLPYGVIAYFVTRIVRLPYHIGIIGEKIKAQIQGARGILLRRVLSEAASISVPGEELQAELSALGVDKKKIFILPHGLRSEFALNHDVVKKYDCIFAGDLLEVKRVHLIITAWAKVVRKKPEAKLCIVGDGPQRKNLESLALQLGLNENIHFAGYQSEIINLLWESKLFILASLSEGLPFAMIEAMVCGVVPVVNNVGSISSLVQDGVNGCLLNTSEEMDEYSAGILDLLNDDEKLSRFSNAARRAVKHLTFQAVTKQWENILKSWPGKNRK